MIKSVFLFKSVLKQLFEKVLLIDFCSTVEYSVKNLDFCKCFACRRLCKGRCTKGAGHCSFHHGTIIRII